MEKKWEIQDVPPKPIIPDKQVELILTRDEVCAVFSAVKHAYGYDNPIVALFKEIQIGLDEANA